jgi:hypothetical protein
MSDDIKADNSDILRWELEHVTQRFQALSEIRFKLLSLIPPIGGAGIFILGLLSDSSKEQIVIQGLLTLLSLLGFFVTLGIAFYDQRNSELYDALIIRAKFLEENLKLIPNSDCTFSKRNHGGFFSELPPRSKKLFNLITLGHDTGLALLYGSLIGSWFFPFTIAGVRTFGYSGHYLIWIAFASSLIAILFFILGLLRLDSHLKG